MSSSTIYSNITKKGNLSARTHRGTTLRTEVLMEKLVRYDLAKINGKSLLSDSDLAKIFGCSTRWLSVKRKSTSYLLKRVELTTGIAPETELSVKENTDKHKQLLELMLPDAFRVLANNLRNVPNNSVDRRLQTTVALEVLDRQGAFPKISRTDSHLKIEHNYSDLDAVSKDLLESVSAPQSREAAELKELLEVNKVFSNSDTIAEVKQEAALKILESTKLEGPVN